MMAVILSTIVYLPGGWAMHYSLLRIVPFVLLGCVLSAAPADAAKPEGAGGGPKGSSPTALHVQDSASSPKTIGLVAGTAMTESESHVVIALDPSFAPTTVTLSSPAYVSVRSANATGNPPIQPIIGFANGLNSQVFFSNADCTGSVYFITNYSPYIQTFVGGTDIDTDPNTTTLPVYALPSDATISLRSYNSYSLPHHPESGCTVESRSMPLYEATFFTNIIFTGSLKVVTQ
jgi:hypothetical protein